MTVDMPFRDDPERATLVVLDVRNNAPSAIFLLRGEAVQAHELSGKPIRHMKIEFTCSETYLWYRLKYL